MSYSIAMCTCNGEPYLETQPRSFLAQTRPPSEIVIGDDASTDGTLAILERFRQRCSARVRILAHTKRMGTIANVDQVLRSCSEQIILLSDQDDEWLPGKGAELLRIFTAHADALLVFSNGSLIDSEDRPLGSTLWEKWGFTAQVGPSVISVGCGGGRG